MTTKSDLDQTGKIEPSSSQSSNLEVRYKIPERLLDAQVPWAQLKPEKFHYINCLLCGSSQYVALASLVINWIEFFLVRCPQCGLIWRNPIPDQVFLRDLYSEAYYNVAKYSPELIYQVGIADADINDQNRRRDRTRLEVADWIRRGITCTTEFNEKRWLLEIGGGRGYLQQAAAERGWNTIGLEISPHGIKAAITKGLLVLPLTLDELCDKYIPYIRYFDVVVFFDFLEHVTDPGQVLRLARYILKDDGMIILRIPKTPPEGYPKLHLIDHIWHFSESTLEAFLRKEGFKITDSHESGIFRAPSGDVIENITVFARKQES